MPDDVDLLLRRFAAGDAGAAAEVLSRAQEDDHPGQSISTALLVAAALLSADPAPLLARAAGHAASTRDRQLLALARAALDHDRLALVADHLIDHPDSVLAAWIGAGHRPAGSIP